VVFHVSPVVQRFEQLKTVHEIVLRGAAAAFRITGPLIMIATSPDVTLGYPE
jgi:hypothetical protein